VPWCAVRDELSLALFARITVLGPRFMGDGAHFEVCAIISDIRPNRVYPKGTLPIVLAMKKVAINAAIFTPQDVEG